MWSETRRYEGDVPLTVLAQAMKAVPRAANISTDDRANCIDATASMTFRSFGERIRAIRSSGDGRTDVGCAARVRLQYLGWGIERDDVAAFFRAFEAIVEQDGDVIGDVHGVRRPLEPERPFARGLAAVRRAFASGGTRH